METSNFSSGETGGIIVKRKMSNERITRKLLQRVQCTRVLYIMKSTFINYLFNNT